LALIDFTSQLKAADSLVDLARRLGSICLEEGKELGRMKRDEQTRQEIKRIEMGAAEVSQAAWEEVIADPSLFEERAGSKFVAAIKRARMRQPLDFYGVLRGLCRKPLAELYATAEDQLGLDRGMPVLFATRPIHQKFECTTKQTTLNRGKLLHPLPYSLFESSAGSQVRVVLDFSQRDRIDELTWRGEDGLPRIATLHPESGEVDVKVKDGRFFDVRPKDWDPGPVLALLASAKDAEVAVLPELSLPSPDALDAELTSNADVYPPLIVAGSAHSRLAGAGGGNEIRVNESLVYLDGKRVAIARKHHPFATKRIAGKAFPDEVEEDLTGEQTTIMVLSGRRTRVAVVICADLLESDIPSLLVAAGVNLLLAPAMTRKIGSFNASICEIAGYCQGVTAIANARWSADGKPFLCMVGTPRPSPSEQSAALTGEGVEPPPKIGIFDPNEPLPGAVEWR
jgi:hypothetical protein